MLIIVLTIWENKEFYSEESEDGVITKGQQESNYTTNILRFLLIPITLALGIYYYYTHLFFYLFIM